MKKARNHNYQQQIQHISLKGAGDEIVHTCTIDRPFLRLSTILAFGLSAIFLSGVILLLFLAIYLQDWLFVFLAAIFVVALLPFLQILINDIYNRNLRIDIYRHGFCHIRGNKREFFRWEDIIEFKDKSYSYAGVKLWRFIVTRKDGLRVSYNESLSDIHLFFDLVQRRFKSIQTKQQKLALSNKQLPDQDSESQSQI